MVINFNKEMKQDYEDKVPELVVNYLSEGLPEGTKYEMDNKGNLVLVSTQKKITIGGLELQQYDEIKGKIGGKPSYADILQFSYNAQVPLHFKSEHKGYLNINGQDIPIDKIKYNPLHEFESVKDGEFIAVPKEFPDMKDIDVGCEQYHRKLKVRRIPNDSLYKIVIQSEVEEPLSLKWVFNSKDMESSFINISIKLKYAKTVRDIVESIYIFNAFIDNKGTINSQKVSLAFDDGEVKKLNENYALLWEKALEIENVLRKDLNISFTKIDSDLDEKTVALIEELYQSLILKKPVRKANNVTSIGGINDIEDIEGLDKAIGDKLFVVYGDIQKVELFNAAFNVYSLNGIIDAVVSNYEIEDGRLIIYFDNDGKDKRPFLSTLDFLNNKELDDYQKGETGTSLENIFRDAESLDNLVEAVFE